MLLPREHGTYGEIAFPLTTALLIGAPDAGAWGLVLTAVGGYLAHEGFLVLTGLRGGRARREQGRAAVISLAVFGALAATGVALAIPVLTGEARTGAVVAAVLSVIAVVSALIGRQHTMPGELLAAAALPAWGLPVALQGGVGWPQALTAWGVWSMGYAAATCVVHVVISRTKKQPAGAALAGTVAFALAGPVISPAALPLSLVSAALVWLPVSARRLRDVGWSVMGASAVTLILLTT